MEFQSKLAIWQLIVTAVVGGFTIAVYLSLRNIQKQEAKAASDLATIATLQNQKSQARFVAMGPKDYPFKSSSAETRSSHPAFSIHLANTGWKASEVLFAVSTWAPAMPGLREFRPTTEVRRQGDYAEDLLIEPGRTARLRISLEPNDLPEPFIFKDYHVELKIEPVAGLPATLYLINPDAQVPPPASWPDVTSASH